MDIENLKSFEEGKVELNPQFLTFAKKNSVVNICKKFNQMVHDSLCALKIKTKMSGTVKKGVLKIINIKCTGPFGDAEVKLKIDSISFSANGQINNYLLGKPFFF